MSSSPDRHITTDEWRGVASLVRLSAPQCGEQIDDCNLAIKTIIQTARAPSTQALYAIKWELFWKSDLMQCTVNIPVYTEGVCAGHFGPDI